MIRVWSDTHFNHRGILEHCKASRPYADIFEMNADLVRRWNSTVEVGDDVYLLGDFGFSVGSGDPLKTIFSWLNGRKHLVIGNHDERNPKVLKLPWVSKQDLVTLRENGGKAVACHYPLETWKGAHKGYLMLHGHSHGSLKRVIPHRFDVGADVRRAPVSLAALFLEAQAQPYQPQDHHGDL